MTKIKKIVAAAIATISMGAVTATASAGTILTPPVNWQAVYAQGAPSSVNKTYLYSVYTYGNGHDITCTSFTGDYNRAVVVKKQYNVKILSVESLYEEEVAELHATTYSPIHVENPENNVGNTITFSFKASEVTSCEAYGVISHHT